MLVKHERNWFSRNESISGVFLGVGGAVGFHPATDSQVVRGREDADQALLRMGTSCRRGPA